MNKNQQMLVFMLAYNLWKQSKKTDTNAIYKKLP